MVGNTGDTDNCNNKRGKNILRLSEKSFYRIFDLIPGISCIVDLPDQRIKCVNQSFFRITNYSPEEIIGRQITSLVSPAENLQEINNIINSGVTVKNQEIRFLTKLGEERLGIVSSEHVYFKGQNCLIYSLYDITELNKIQEENERLRQISLVGEMALGIGHEIRNPLTTVRGFLQMFRNKPCYSEDKEYFNIMIEELDKANAIISEYLNLASNKVVQTSRSNLNDLIIQLKPFMKSLAETADKRIIFSLEKVPDLLLDKKEIKKLILNLVENGLDSMPKGKLLTIKTYVKGNNVYLEVIDQGCGIDKSIMDKIALPFFTTKEKGTGLGLSVCYSIAERHNANLSFKTGHNGTAFIVTFKKNFSECVYESGSDYNCVLQGVQ